MHDLQLDCCFTCVDLWVFQMLTFFKTLHSLFDIREETIKITASWFVLIFQRPFLE